jgi:hypothetical protein
MGEDVRPFTGVMSGPWGERAACLAATRGSSSTWFRLLGIDAVGTGITGENVAGTGMKHRRSGPPCARVGNGGLRASGASSERRPLRTDDTRVRTTTTARRCSWSPRRWCRCPGWPGTCRSGWRSWRVSVQREVVPRSWGSPPPGCCSRSPVRRSEAQREDRGWGHGYGVW